MSVVLYAYSVYSEHDQHIKDYLSTEPPPKVGETIKLIQEKIEQDFEVMDVQHKTERSNEVVLIVRPIVE